MSNKERREWCYIQQPIWYEIAPCSCGNENTQWSEFKKHIWCDICNIDFIPEHNGIFDGSIPFHCAELMGISFDRIDLTTFEVIKFDINSLKG